MSEKEHREDCLVKECNQRQLRMSEIEHNLNLKFMQHKTKKVDTIMTDHQVAAEFDASGLRCPMPILKTKKEVSSIAIGEIIRIIATDIGTKKDFPAWASRSGNEILELVEEGDKLIWYIKRIK